MSAQRMECHAIGATHRSGRGGLCVALAQTRLRMQREIRSLLERDSFRRFLSSKVSLALPCAAAPYEAQSACNAQMHRELMVAVEAEKNGSFIIHDS